MIGTSPPSLSDRYESLFRVSRAISAHRDIPKLFEALAIELHGVVPFGMIGIALFGESGEIQQPVMLRLSDQATPTNVGPLQMEGTMTGWVHRNRRALVIPDLDKETRFPNGMKLLQSLRMRSAVSLPLQTAHRRIGSLSFSSEDPHVYSDEEVRFLTLVADVVAVAIDDALNFEASRSAQDALRKEKNRLGVLLELTTAAVSTLDLSEVAQGVARSVRNAIRSDTVGVAFPDPRSRVLRVQALEGVERDLEKEPPIPPDSPSATVYRSGKPYICNRREDRPAEIRDPFLDDFGSVCVLPLGNRERVLGILALARREENSFQPEDLDFLGQVASQVAIAIENALAYTEIIDLKEKLAQEKLYLEDEIQEGAFGEIVGESPLLRQALRLLMTVAPTDSTVLLLGETGTGKELFARAIHARSPRKHRTFVRLNCAAIPTGLLESELFGHERGAFTGAISQKIGRLELADQGTLFLDEIGDIPLELQPKLLRALQDREFERLGSTTTRMSNARLVAATNRNIEKMVEKKQFRKDLFYRLNVFPISIPALRDRVGDVPLLVNHFTRRCAGRMGKSIESVPTGAMKRMSDAFWPGNVRELENLIERAAILTRGNVLEVPLEGLRTGALPVSGGQSAARDRLLRILEETKGRVSGPKGAAQRLGLKRTTLSARLKKLGINPREFS